MDFEADRPVRSHQERLSVASTTPLVGSANLPTRRPSLSERPATPARRARTRVRIEPFRNRGATSAQSMLRVSAPRMEFHQGPRRRPRRIGLGGDRMNFTQWDLGSRHEGEIVEVTLQGTAANVELLDSSNLSAFKSGRSHRYYGGHYTRSPARIPIPHSGHWYVAVHLGGYGGSVRSGVRVLPGALPPVRQIFSSPLSSIRQAADDYSQLVGTVPDTKVYDVFISHASEDKDDVVDRSHVPLPSWASRAGTTSRSFGSAIACGGRSTQVLADVASALWSSRTLSSTRVGPTTNSTGSLPGRSPAVSRSSCRSGTKLRRPT